MIERINAMEYKNCIGEKVINSSGEEGVIDSIDKSGVIHIKFDRSQFSGGFMFDPFVNGYVRFVKKELQEVVDKEIAEIESNA